MNEQQKYFKRVEDISAVPLQVSNIKFYPKIGTYKPGARFNPEHYDIHDERNVAVNEIVFDLDNRAYVKNYKMAKQIIDILQSLNVYPILCSTGGKGLHIHIFFEKICFSNDDNKKLMKEAFSYGMNWKHIRLWYLNYILDEAGISEKIRGKGKILDTAPITFNYFAGTSHLIRDIGGMKKTRNEEEEKVDITYKTAIPLNEFDKKKISIKNFSNVKYPTEIIPFKIDEGELCEFLKSFINSSKNRKIIPYRNEKLHIPYTEIDGVLKLREGLQTGNRSNGAMYIAIACKIDQKSKAEASEIMKEYVKGCSQVGHVFTLTEAEQWINWIYQQERVYWNCSQLEELGVHNKETCEFCQAKHKESTKLLTSSGILKHIKEVLDVEVIGEAETKMLIFMLALSKDFPSPTGTPDWNIPSDSMSQNIILASDSSSGKSYVAKKVIALFGEKDQDIFIISRISKSALNYYTETNMDNKVLFVEELQGLDENTAQMRVWMSEGSLTLDTVEKVEGEDGIERNAKITKTTKGQPVFITCQAEGVVEEQFNNRSWILSMDSTETQTSDILKYQDKLVKGNILMDETKKRVLKDALKQLKPYHFKIPYANSEVLGIPVNDVRSRRDYQKFLTLIKCSAYLHQKQRTIETDEQHREFIICDIMDYDIALQYSQNILGATFSGLTAQQIVLINTIRKSTWKDEFTVTDIQRLKGKSHTHWHGQMNQLEDLGYVTSDKQIGKATIYSINEQKAYNIISLPTGAELLEKLKEIEPTLKCFSKINENMNFVMKKNPFKFQKHFKVSNIEYIKGTLKNDLKVLKMQNESLLGRKSILKPRNALRLNDINDFIKNHEKHAVSYEDIHEFANSWSEEELDKNLDFMKKQGMIFENKPGYYISL